MAGYANDFSKSNNAHQAESRGRMTASALARYAATRWCRLLGLTAGDVAATLRPREWHHTSVRYNCTDYYEPEDLIERGVRGRLYQLVVARRAAKKAAPITLTGCVVKWLEWSGTRKHPKATEYEAAGVTIQFKPQSSLVIITGDSLPTWTGGTLRKKLSTRGFELRGGDGRRIMSNPCDGDATCAKSLV